MKPSEAFGVVVRTLGLLLVMSGAWLVFWALLTLVLGGPGSGIGMLIIATPLLLAGIWFLGGAESLVSWAYPDSRESRRRSTPEENADQG